MKQAVKLEGGTVNVVGGRMAVLERARRYAAKCPGAVSGQRGHDTTFRVAAVLWNGFALSEEETLTVLGEWNKGCQPPWSDEELLHKVQSVAGATHSRQRGYLVGQKIVHTGAVVKKGLARSPGPTAKAQKAAKPRKPKFRPMVLKRIAAKIPGIHDIVRFIMSRSPVPVEGLGRAAFLRLLYPKGSREKVLVFANMKSQGQLVWDSDEGDSFLEEDFPAGPDGVWFLAQPVDGRYHQNPRMDGKQSRRSGESVTAWRYAVLESDKANPDEWLRCLVQLPLRIASVCESGGRSIHALVRVDAASKADWDSKIEIIKPILVTLGADPGALSAVRLTRLPQAMRGSRVQRLLYLNPAPDRTPIVDKAIGQGIQGEAGAA